MLTIKGLDTGYGKKQIIYGLDLDAAAGKVTAIIGPNGSGKSTLLKAAFGLIPIWKGNIFFNNSEITNLTSKALVQKGLAFVPQGNQVFDELSVMENLEIGGRYFPKVQFQNELKKIWDIFPELQERKKQNSGKLSGGEKQMLALGRALISDPSLILMDEPSLGLSPKLVSQMMNHLQKINREFGKTILIVEQKVKKVLEIADHVYSIKLGRIAFSGPPDQLKNDSRKMKKLFL